MPNWSGTVLTGKGRALQAKVEAGATMQFTKLKIGDGILTAGQDIDSLNDLIGPKKNVGISGLTPLENGVCKIAAVVTNEGLATGFYVRELGVFAQDPDAGEILYAYSNDGAPDFLPAAGGSVAVAEELVIHMAFTNAANITAVISLDGLVTARQMADHNHDGTPGRGQKISYVNLIDKPPDPVSFGLEAPTQYDAKTLWLRNIGGAPDFSMGGGVVIANATTAAAEPDIKPPDYWFEEQKQGDVL